MRKDRDRILEEELLIVRHSGEIPEITLHHSLYYLEQDPEGPGLKLSRDEIVALQDQALERSREIVLRDLNPDNRDLGIYRGVKRSICNWQRHQRFLQRIGRQDPGFCGIVAQALVSFLDREARDVFSGARKSVINCSQDELLEFARVIGCDPASFPGQWRSLCPGHDQEKG